MRWDAAATGTCMPPRAVQALGYADAALNITTDILFAVAIPAAAPEGARRWVGLGRAVSSAAAVLRAGGAYSSIYLVCSGRGLVTPLRIRAVKGRLMQV